MKPLCMVIVAENASMRMGGEAARPLQYFLHLLRRDVDVRLVTHERTREELESLIPERLDRVHFVADRPIQRLLWRCHRLVPTLLYESTLGALVHLVTQIHQRRLIRRLVAEQGVNLVHEPIPISPKRPSLMYGFGVPVVIGPLNGNMDYPPAFRRRESALTRLFVGLGRCLAHPLNWVIPGKRRAAVILVSNERTAAALPRGCRGEVIQLVANATDMAIWKPGRRTDCGGEPPRFVFLGRLVPFKVIDVLIDAFANVVRSTPARLQIIGDGPERSSLEAQCKRLGVSEQVEFCGWLKHEEAVERMSDADVFVFPSLRDPGGAVIMEAMCLGLPVVAGDWGGPPDYAGPDSGFLVKPVNYQQYVDDLADAMRRMAESPELRRTMGDAARAKAMAEFDWNHRVDRLVEIYSSILDTPTDRGHS